MGRAAPEIDVFEATIDSGIGKVSQSAQWAPYNVRFSLCAVIIKVNTTSDTGWL